MKQRSISSFFTKSAPACSIPAPTPIVNMFNEKENEENKSFDFSEFESNYTTLSGHNEKISDIASLNTKTSLLVSAPSVILPALIDTSDCITEMCNTKSDMIISIQSTQPLCNIDQDNEEDEEKEEMKPGFNEMSEYERIRAENIRRNAEFLASLGLEETSKFKAASTVTKTKSTSNSARKRTRSPPPARRSSRVANVPPPNYTHEGISIKLESVVNENVGDSSVSELEEETEIDDSNVLKYVMSCEAHVNHQKFTAKTACNPTSLLLRDHMPLECANLPAIYSLQAHPRDPLLLAAGKGGYVAVFHTPFAKRSAFSPLLASSGEAPEASNVLCSFKAHDRWVASAQFVDTLNHGQESVANVGTLPVITASDDATVKLFDVSKSYYSKKTQSHQPVLLWTSKTMHDRGIFALDTYGTRVVTGSKDRTVAVGTIDPTGSVLVPTNRFALHSGVVKSVDWQRGSGTAAIFASGGQDRCVSIRDTRAPSQTGPDGERAEISIEECHEGGVHTVQWNPFAGSEYQLLTAGMDPVIKIFDLRCLRQEHPRAAVSSSVTPISELRGHTSSHVKKFNSIVTPAFLSADTVLAAGQGSTKLSIYNTQSGKAISRGDIEVEPSGCAVGNNSSGTTVFAVSKGQIYCLDVQ